jgi:poly(3-hydroxybutyrate) depolymerase
MAFADAWVLGIQALDRVRRDRRVRGIGDQVVPDNGGPVGVIPNLSNLIVPSSPDSVAYWVGADGCSGGPPEVAEDWAEPPATRIPRAPAVSKWARPVSTGRRNRRRESRSLRALQSHFFSRFAVPAAC